MQSRAKRENEALWPQSGRIVERNRGEKLHLKYLSLYKSETIFLALSTGHWLLNN